MPIIGVILRLPVGRFAGAEYGEEILRDLGILNRRVIRPQIPSRVVAQKLLSHRRERMPILLCDDQSVGSTQGEQHIRRTFGKIKVRPQRVRTDAGIVLQPGK